MPIYKDLFVYRKSFALALEIHKISEQFPKQEQFSLTSQIRRSSRSICSSIAEAFRKRRYRAYFISKISDADMENSECIVWIEFCEAFGYIQATKAKELIQRFEEVGRLLNNMIEHPERYGVVD